MTTKSERLEEIRTEVGEWANEEFPGQPEINPLRGIDEEKGEFVHSTLKRDQGIRLDEDGVGEDAERDAIGDMFIYLCDWSYRKDYQFDWVLEPNVYNSTEEAWRDLVDKYASLVGFESKGYAHSFINTLWGLAEVHGYDFMDCVELAWDGEVSNREWESSYKDNTDGQY